MGACFSGGLFFSHTKRPNFVPVCIPTKVNANGNANADGYGYKKENSRCFAPCVPRKVPATACNFSNSNNNSNSNSNSNDVDNTDSKDSDCIQSISILIPITQETIPFVRTSTPRFKVKNTNTDRNTNNGNDDDNDNDNSCGSGASDSTPSTLAQPVDTVGLEQMLRELAQKSPPSSGDAIVIVPKMASVLSDPASSTPQVAHA